MGRSPRLFDDPSRGCVHPNRSKVDRDPLQIHFRRRSRVERLLARLHVERLRQRRRDQEEVLEQIIAQFERDGCDADTVDGFRSIEPMLNGLYSFGWGYTTEIVEETQ